jgi:hypothetical protein
VKFFASKRRPDYRTITEAFTGRSSADFTELYGVTLHVDIRLPVDKFPPG